MRMASSNLAAWVAVGISAVSGTGLTIYHWGQSAQQIAVIEQKQTQTDAHVSKHDDQLTDIVKQEARIEQKLDDVASTVHDMHDNGVKRK